MIPLYLEHRKQHDTGKRLFIGLVMGTALSLCAMLVLLWIIPTLGFSHIHPWLPTITAIILISIICIVMLFACWLTACAWFGQYGHSIRGTRKMWGMISRILLPLMEGVGRLLSLPTDRVRRSFIKVNNEIVLGSHITCSPEKILVLLPHCIQASKCTNRLTYSIDNCRRCGMCPVGTMLKFRDDWGIRLEIAVGGSIARRIVVQARPQLIIAVACERDLSSGIQDTAPIPVYGIINERPFGPCIDTQVNIQHLELALTYFSHKL